MSKLDTLVTEDFYKILLENSSEILTVVSEEGIVKYESPSVQKILGYDWNEDIAVACCDWVHPDDKENVRKIYEQASSKFGVALAVECKLVSRHGEIIYTEGTITNMLHVAGINGYVSNLNDITQRKKAETALLKSREKFLNLVNTVNGIVWEADAKTLEFTFVSKQAEEILGYPVRMWMKDSNFWQNHIHPDDRDWAIEYCADNTKKKQSHNFEYRMTAEDGRIVWLQDFVTVIVENDTPIYIRGIMVDITNQKNAEQELKVKEQHYKNLIKQSSSAIILLDENAKFLYQSLAVEKIVGYKVEEESHTNAFQFVHPDELEEVKKLYEDLLSNPGKSVTREFRFLHQDGHYIWIEGTITNLLHDESIKALIVNYHDISERKYTQEELEKSEANLHL